MWSQRLSQVGLFTDHSFESIHTDFCVSGQHNEKRASHGHTMIIDPWGTICESDQLCHVLNFDDQSSLLSLTVAQLHGEDEGVCYAELSKKYLFSIRNNMPVQNHKRPDLY